MMDQSVLLSDAAAGRSMSKRCKSAGAGERSPAEQAPSLEIGRAFGEILNAVYETSGDERCWEQALRRLGALCNADDVALVVKQTGEAGISATRAPDTVIGVGPHLAGAGVLEIDPFINLPETGAVSSQDEDADRIDFSSLQRLRTKYPIRHVLGCDSPATGGVRLQLRLMRGVGKAPFGLIEKDLCQRVMSHFKQALEIRHVVMDREATHHVLADIIDRVPYGVVVLDGRGTVRRINQEARRIAREKDGLWLNGRSIVIGDKQERRSFHEAVQKALDTEGTDIRSVAVSISRSFGRTKLGAIVQSSRSVRGAAAGLPAAIVYLRDPDAVHKLASGELIRRLFELTRTEAALALLIANGQGLVEAAHSLGVQKNTVRTHLRALFRKTGARRQAHLIQMVLRSLAIVC